MPQIMELKREVTTRSFLPSRFARLPLTDVAMLIVGVLLIYQLSGLFFSIRPGKAILDGIDQYWKLMRDPRQGAQVSLASATTLEAHPHEASGQRPRAYLVCVLSACDT